MSEAEQKESKYSYELGELWLSTKDTKISMIKYDRMAFIHDELMFLSVFGEKGRIKQLRALLWGKAKGLTIEARGPRCFRQGDMASGQSWLGKLPSRLQPSGEGYTMKRKDLEYNMAHAMFVAKDQGFMLVMNQLALFKQIRRSTIKTPITTPFIPEWLPYIDKKLREEYLLEECYGYRCQCGQFSAGSNALERIIREGLVKGKITIPPPPNYDAPLV